MPENVLAAYFEKGFFAACGLICTWALGAVSFHAKQDRDFRKAIHAKVDKNSEVLHKRLTEHQEYLHRNYPDNADFQLMMENMNNQHKALHARFDSMERDVREIRAKL